MAVRRLLRFLAGACTSLALLPAPGVAGAAEALPETPPGDVLVLTINLQEAYGADDLSSLREMRVFVDRAMALLEQAPDVLLLQEVRDRSANKVATLLSEATSMDYYLAVDPGHPPSTLYDNRQVLKDTAIVLNRTTMQRIGRGSFVATSYPQSAAAPGELRMIKKHAHGLVQERASGQRLSLASIHYVHAPKIRSAELSDEYRARWSAEIADLLAATYPSAASLAMGGDFNQGRCLEGIGANCDTASFWDVLTSPPYNFIEAIRPIVGYSETGGVDYVFTSAEAVSAGIDAEYEGEGARGDPDRFYSDHKMRWTVLRF